MKTSLRLLTLLLGCSLASCILPTQNVGTECQDPPNKTCYLATGTWDEAAKVCSYSAKAQGTACDDGNPATANDVCNGAGQCAGTTAQCTFGQDQTCNGDPVSTPEGVCTKSGVCSCKAGYSLNTTTGKCISCPSGCVTPPDLCHAGPATLGENCECNYPVMADGTACDDGNAATSNDVCTSGHCAGLADAACTFGQNDTCNDHPSQGVSGVCNADGTCTCNSGYSLNSQTGRCMACPSNCAMPPTPCFEQFGTIGGPNCRCVYPPKPEGTACDDGNAATSNDVCDSQGLCLGTQAVCIVGQDDTCNDDPQATGNEGVCTGSGTCTCNSGYSLNTQTRRCKACPSNCVTPPDLCHAGPATLGENCVCNFPVLPDGTACDDGNANTANDVCTSGSCAGVPQGVCTFGQDQTCNDDLIVPSILGVCSRDGTCTCSSGTSLNSATGRCMICASNCATPPSACFEQSGTIGGPNCQCVYPPKPTGTACDDGNPATTGDHCDGQGSCI
ncbi:MAG: hypothetical protein QM765_30400 [Myxococcales bacterium]